MQFTLRRRAEHEQLAHGQRPELLFHFPRKERVHLVRLFKVPRHFCQQFITGYADVDREAQLVINLLPKQLRRRDRRAVKPFRARHVRPRLVDGILLHHGRKILQKRDQTPRGLHIQAIIRRHEHQLRTFFLRLKNRLAGFHAALLRRQAFGQNDAMAVGLLACDRRRNLAQIKRLAQHAHAIGCRP